MHYLGGKYRKGKQIAGYLNQIRLPGQPYNEPFCGSLWVTQYIADAPIYASDKHPFLIATLQSVQAGWVPPYFVGEDEYNFIKDNQDWLPPNLVGFVGFGCSFGGKWFGGYARDRRSDRPYSTQAQKGLLLKVGRVGNKAQYFVADFLVDDPPEEGCLIYCDPPYDGTTGYGSIVGDFDSSLFWKRVLELESRGHTLVVSEYDAPDGFTCVMEMPTQTDLSMADGTKEFRMEKLFRPGDHKPLQGRLL